MSLPAIPATWLAALRPGGRLVFSLAGGSVIITADKTPDGGAAGRVELHPASFMAARHGPGRLARPELPEPALSGDGDQVTATRSPYPIVDLAQGWELDALLSVSCRAAPAAARPKSAPASPRPGSLTRTGPGARAMGNGSEPPRPEYGHARLRRRAHIGAAKTAACAAQPG